MRNKMTYWIEINIDEIYLYGKKTPLLKDQQLEVQMINGEAKIIIDGIPHKNLLLFKDKTYTISSLIGMNYISDITGQIERNNKLNKLGIE
jgi:hypothetical protein